MRTWINAILQWGHLDRQNYIGERLLDNVNIALFGGNQQGTLEGTHNLPQFAQTTDQSLGGRRIFAALPSQGNWFSPPPNPPADQSWKL